MTAFKCAVQLSHIVSFIFLAATNGVVLATEKKVPSTLVEPDTMEKVALFTNNIAVVYSGMGPDFRVLVRKGQKKASEYALVYGVSILVVY